MIIANVSHKGAMIPVEVTSVITAGDGRKLAAVRALEGQPFTAWTSGGWIETDQARVSVNSLADIAVSVDLPSLAAIPQEA